MGQLRPVVFHVRAQEEIRALPRDVRLKLGSALLALQRGFNLAVEEVFDVHVVTLTTMSGLGKIKRLGRSVGRRPNWKSAIVRVAAGQKIDIYEAV